MDVKIITLVKDAATDNRISCKNALEIADSNSIPRKKMGELLNSLKIKIRDCQLGCF